MSTIQFDVNQILLAVNKSENNLLPFIKNNQIYFLISISQIEELFESFRTLPQESRAIIWAKIRIKLLEEFKGNDSQYSEFINSPSFTIKF